MKYDFHIIVIGGGSGGLVVASGAAALGARVALIEAEKMGGDCLNAGCVPSKTFLKSAHLAKQVSTSSEFGIQSKLEVVDLEKIMSRVNGVIKKIEPHDSTERFEKMGVRVFSGHGKFTGPHSIEVNGEIITGKNIVIATGSAPAVPPIKGLDQGPFLTNRNIFQLKKLPEHLIVLGGGPIGLELGQGFRHLGSKVTIVEQSSNIFGKDDVEVGVVLEKKFIEDGISMMLESVINEVVYEDGAITVLVEKDGKPMEIKGDQLLVSLGRNPVSAELDLEKAGVTTDKRGFIITNKKLQTVVPHIYACGDVTGPYQFTHMAGYQAGIVIRNIIFHLGAKLDYSFVPWTTYTKPEVAHVGYTETWAKEAGVYQESILTPLSENDRAQVQGDLDGFLKLILGKKGLVIGATLVGEKAGDMIPIASLAIRKKMKVSAFLNIIYSYPTETEIFQLAALSQLKKSVKEWQKKLIKIILLR